MLPSFSVSIPRVANLLAKAGGKGITIYLINYDFFNNIRIKLNTA